MTEHRYTDQNGNDQRQHIELLLQNIQDEVADQDGVRTQVIGDDFEWTEEDEINRDRARLACIYALLAAKQFILVVSDGEVGSEGGSMQVLGLSQKEMTMQALLTITAGIMQANAQAAEQILSDD